MSAEVQVALATEPALAGQQPAAVISNGQPATTTARRSSISSASVLPSSAPATATDPPQPAAAKKRKRVASSSTPEHLDMLPPAPKYARRYVFDAEIDVSNEAPSAERGDQRTRILSFASIVRAEHDGLLPREFEARKYDKVVESGDEQEEEEGDDEREEEDGNAPEDTEQAASATDVDQPAGNDFLARLQAKYAAIERDEAAQTVGGAEPTANALKKAKKKKKKDKQKRMREEWYDTDDSFIDDADEFAENVGLMRPVQPGFFASVGQLRVVPMDGMIKASHLQARAEGEPAGDGYSTDDFDRSADASSSNKKRRTDASTEGKHNSDIDGSADRGHGSLRMQRLELKRRLTKPGTTPLPPCVLYKMEQLKKLADAHDWKNKSHFPQQLRPHFCELVYTYIDAVNSASGHGTWAKDKVPHDVEKPEAWHCPDAYAAPTADGAQPSVGDTPADPPIPALPVAREPFVYVPLYWDIYETAVSHYSKLLQRRQPKSSSSKKKKTTAATPSCVVDTTPSTQDPPSGASNPATAAPGTAASSVSTLPLAQPIKAPSKQQVEIVVSPPLPSVATSSPFWRQSTPLTLSMLLQLSASSGKPATEADSAPANGQANAPESELLSLNMSPTGSTMTLLDDNFLVHLSHILPYNLYSLERYAARHYLKFVAERDAQHLDFLYQDFQEAINDQLRRLDMATNPPAAGDAEPTVQQLPNGSTEPTPMVVDSTPPGEAVAESLSKKRKAPNKRKFRWTAELKDHFINIVFKETVVAHLPQLKDLIMTNVVQPVVSELLIRKRVYKKCQQLFPEGTIRKNEFTQILSDWRGRQRQREYDIIEKMPDVDLSCLKATPRKKSRRSDATNGEGATASAEQQPPGDTPTVAVPPEQQATVVKSKPKTGTGAPAATQSRESNAGKKRKRSDVAPAAAAAPVERPSCSSLAKLLLGPGERITIQVEQQPTPNEQGEQGSTLPVRQAFYTTTTPGRPHRFPERPTTRLRLRDLFDEGELTYMPEDPLDNWSPSDLLSSPLHPNLSSTPRSSTPSRSFAMPLATPTASSSAVSGVHHAQTLPSPVPMASLTAIAGSSSSPAPRPVSVMSVAALISPSVRQATPHDDDDAPTEDEESALSDV
ncbi:hypothetical protein RI367_006661 [Sorochytrium milnesiophthora]